MIILNGFFYPIYSAVYGLIWGIGRVIYGTGYSIGGPKNRMYGGIISHFGDFPLLILKIMSAYRLISLINWKIKN